MTAYKQLHADRGQAASSAFRSGRRMRGVAARAVRALKLTVADALCAYPVTGSAFATLMMLAAPHLEVFLRCMFHAKG
jgi:hypothetical protein